jgi:hypothetical protein
VGPRAGLDRCGNSRPHRDSIPGPSSLYPVAIPTELPGPQVQCTVWKYQENTLVEKLDVDGGTVGK